MPARPFVIAVDLGGTKVSAAAFTLDGSELSRAQRAAPHGDAAAGIRAIIGAAEDAADRAGLVLPDALALGIGAPGVVPGGIIHAHNLGWGEVALQAELARELDLPVKLENDCTTGGLGELRSGAGAGRGTIAYLGVGTGVGGCVLDPSGRVLAQELGHVVVSFTGGPVCGCGARGCAEAFAGGRALGERAQEAGLDVDAAGLAAAAARGDEQALAVWQQGLRALGALCGSLQTTFQPEVIVIGGGVAQHSGPGYVDAIQAQAKQFVMQVFSEELTVVPAAHGTDSVLFGAFELARRELFGPAELTLVS